MSLTAAGRRMLENVAAGRPPGDGFADLAGQPAAHALGKLMRDGLLVPRDCDEGPAFEVTLDGREALARKRRIAVRPVDGGQWCLCDDWDCVGQMIEEDGAYEFEFREMTDAEVEALGEFEGW